MAKHKVLIVGGGFGGIKAALELAGNPKFHVTLLVDHTDFRYYPSLYRTATGGKRMISSIPLDEIFNDKRINLVHDKLVSLDRKSRTITTKVGHQIGYESLVLALGVRTNYFSIRGLRELSYGIKTNADAEEFKAHLHNQLIENHKPDLNYIVVGGGPSGIELAGALPPYLRQIAKQHGINKFAIHVSLVEAAPRLVPRMPKEVSYKIAKQLRKSGVKLYLDTTVEAQTAEALMIEGKPLFSQTVVWTAGTSNQPFFDDQGFQLSKNGKVRVDQYLQSETGIYVIGDNADTPYSGMAQTALHDGKFVANNLKRVADKQQPEPYHAKRPIYVFPAGHHWAAVVWGRLRIYGRLGWMLRSLADLIAYHDYEPWQLATRRWASGNDREESCPMCK